MGLEANRGLEAKNKNDEQIADNLKKQAVPKEECIYGNRWNTIHNNYFSDPKVASPLIEVIKNAIKTNQPHVIADLGGGTGFILKELSKQKEISSRLVNVDSSPLQLSECIDERIINLQASVDKISRSQILQTNEDELMIIARSILHYFGYSGLRPLLRHIRSQLMEGEIFVHQSACFEDAKDAECLNLVYKLMSTTKWYATIDNLKAILSDTGFRICDICPTFKLRLESRDLAERYKLSSQQKNLIRKEIEQRYGQKHELFTSSIDDFTVWLHYYVFTCKAI